MATPRSTPMLQVSARSIVLAVVMFGLTIMALGLIAASARVIGWVLTAVTLAALLHPLVNALDRRVPRGIALATVLVGMLTLSGYIAYRVVDDITEQLGELQRALPDAARDIERSERFGETAREAHLAERVGEFVRELPERLRGGSTTDALRAAATRGVAFLATGVLTIFSLVHGPRLLDAAGRQLLAERQRRVRRVASAAYTRWWHYVIGSLGMAAIAGLLAYGCADTLDLPGAAPLAVWMALVDIIPVIGVILGALPIILLAGATSPAWQTVLVAILLLGFQVVETTFLQKRVEQQSVHIGPFLTIAVAMVGLEMYGIGGALVALVGIVLVVAVTDELVDLGSA